MRARGSEFEEQIAFGIARQLFEPMLRAVSSAERDRLLDGVAHVGAQALGVEAGAPPADRFAAVHGLYWLCANRAEDGPLWWRSMTCSGPMIRRWHGLGI